MKYLMRSLLVVLCCWACLAQAEMHVVITKGVDTAIPIAIVPFHWSGDAQAPQNMAQIIANDLQNSGKFNAMSPNDMPQQPTTASQIDYQSWQQKGIDTIVMGSIQPVISGGYLVEYQLIDTLNHPGTVLLSKTFVATTQQLRSVAHEISDAIFEKITGIKGAFNTKIAYVVQTNTDPVNYQLRIADYDGYGEQTLYQTINQPIMSPAWSPDGKQLAFVSFASGYPQLLLLDLATDKTTVLTSYPGHNGAPAFSPDGKQLAFVLSKDGSLNLYVMDLATKKITRLTSGRSNNTEPSWMPDSQNIVYTSDQTGQPQLYEINVASKQIKRLTWDGAQYQNAVVSADGTFLIAVRSANNQQNLAKINMQTGDVQVLTDTFLDETPSISPNGVMVIYSSTQGFVNILNLVSTDGRFKAELPATDGQTSFPAWSPYVAL